MRNHDYAAARTMFEEAAAKWPADARFAKPLAMLYAMFGRGREAVRTLERYSGRDHGRSRRLLRRGPVALHAAFGRSGGPQPDPGRPAGA